jgi:hypothetical protein
MLRQNREGGCEVIGGKSSKAADALKGRTPTDRRRDISWRRVGGAGGASSWSECKPGFQLAKVVSRRTAWTGIYSQTAAGENCRCRAGGRGQADEARGEAADWGHRHRVGPEKPIGIETVELIGVSFPGYV